VEVGLLLRAVIARVKVIAVGEHPKRLRHIGFVRGGATTARIDAHARVQGTRMSDAEAKAVGGGEHRITPLELFFDLVLAFAFTQVTGLLVIDPTWLSVLRGMLVLAALWWA
jgi:Bacterial low temperature requirement A protein (LtrA)